MALKRASSRPAADPAERPARKPVEPLDDEAEVEEDEDALPVQGVRSGWSAGKQTMDATSSFAQAFKPEQSMQIIKFLQDTPYANWRRHWVERQGAQGKVNRPYACPATVGKKCPLCDVGDKVQGVSSFNIAVIGDDGVPILKTWDVGVKLFNVIAAYHADPKVGPVTKGFFGVSQSGKTGGRSSGGQVQTNVSPISPTALRADYEIVAPSKAVMESLKLYTIKDVVQFPKQSELEEIAEELAAAYD